MTSYLRRATRFNVCNGNAFKVIMTHAKWLVLTLIFGIWASDPSPGLCERRLKGPGLTELRLFVTVYECKIESLSRNC